MSILVNKVVKIAFFALVFLMVIESADCSEVIPSPLGDKLISIDLENTDIHSFFRIISEVTELNIVITKDVQGKISSMRLLDVPIRQVFEVVLRMHSLFAVREGNVIIVYPIKSFIARY